MTTYIQAFRNKNLKELNKDISKYLETSEEQDEEYLDIKFSTLPYQDGFIYFAILITKESEE